MLFSIVSFLYSCVPGYDVTALAPNIRPSYCIHTPADSWIDGCSYTIVYLYGIVWKKAIFYCDRKDIAVERKKDGHAGRKKPDTLNSFSFIASRSSSHDRRKAVSTGSALVSEIQAGLESARYVWMRSRECRSESSDVSRRHRRHAHVRECGRTIRAPRDSNNWRISNCSHKSSNMYFFIIRLRHWKL